MTQSTPWLTILLLLPLLGAAAVALLPSGNSELVKRTALVASLIPLGLVAYLGTQFSKAEDGGSTFQFSESHVWIRSFGVHYALGVDGVALALIAMSAILVPAAMLAGWNDVEERGSGSVKEYFIWMLVLETFIIGVFAATDVFLFYVFFEAMLIPVYFLIGRFGGPNRVYAAVKFFLYSLLGGLVMLASLIGLYVLSSEQLYEPSFALNDLLRLGLAPGTEKWLFLGFFLAFAIKAPLVPVHTWLPDAAEQGTPATTTLLVGVLDKVGTFGMLHLCLPLFPNASKWFAPTVLVLGVIGIVYGAIVAVGQEDMRRLIAYTSVSHFGFIAIGIFVMTTLGQSGASFYMVSHGFSTAALLLIVGFLMSRRRSARIADFGGVQKVAPVLAGLFLVAGLSALALPGMSSFVSEFMVLQGVFQRHWTYAAVATLGIVLAAVYVLTMVKRTVSGSAGEQVKGFSDLRGREVAAVAPLIALILVLGFFPQPVLKIIDPTSAWVMSKVQAVDPKSTVAKAGQ